MPILDLGSWRRDLESTFLEFGKIMVFPDDERLRSIYGSCALLAKFAEQEKHFTRWYTRSVPPGFFGDMQQMMSINLNKQTETRSAYGPMVGGALMHMKQMNFNGPVSRERAFRLHKAIAPERAPWGRLVPINDKSLRDGWKMLASVAHLWAAEQWFHHVARIRKEASRFNLRTLPSSGTFPYFLAAADYFLEFGANTIPTRGRDPILSRHEAWRIDIGEPLPKPKEVVHDLFPGLPVAEGELVWPLQPEDLDRISKRAH
jgi:hypothetical protein